MIPLALQKNLKTSITVAIVVAIVLSLSISKAIVKYADKHEHTHLQKLAESMLPSLDNEQIRYLSGSQDDINSSQHSAIKKKLISLRSIDPSYRFVYLMGKNNGQVLFLADAEPVDSEDFSPPGQIYPDASEELHQIFEDGQSFVEGPLTDEWGTWMSAHAAIVDSSDGKVLAILGLDIEADEWAESISSYRLFSNIIILLIISIASIFSFALITIAKDRNNLRVVNTELKGAREELLQKERLAVLGQLNAVVSHELRNPLGTIQTALFSIEDSLERNNFSQVARTLELADRSVGRCVTIIDELSNYARVKDLDVTETSVDDWLRAVFKEQGFPEEITCELNLSSGVRASFDHEKLRQVVVNLMTNAIHALQDKQSTEKHLSVSTHLLDDKYEIRISDNGVGMTSDIKDKVFEPLFSTKGFGVGLGMVIVKNIVDQHQGEIIIESKEGEGTTVTLRLLINLSGERKN